MTSPSTTNAPRPPRRRNLLLKLRPLLRWVLSLRSSPKAIAGGLAMGTFVSLTPTVGIQFIIVVVVATFAKLNRAAAIAPIWITNPVTIAPIYTFNYWIGWKLMGGPHISEVSGLFVQIGKNLAHMQLWQIRDQFDIILHTGKAVIIPLTLGSVVVGTVCGVITWIMAMWLLRQLFERRKVRRKLN